MFIYQLTTEVRDPNKPPADDDEDGREELTRFVIATGTADLLDYIAELHKTNHEELVSLYESHGVAAITKCALLRAFMDQQ